MFDVFYIWAMLTWPMVVVVAPLIYFSRRRVAWRWWEAAAFVLPYAVWIALHSYVCLPKSLANLVELVGLLVALPCAAVLRIILARRLPQLPVAVVLQVLLILVLVFAYFTTPALPE
jgi:hypothetical protein